MKRKLEDLRVIDLKCELEKRGLDKSGVKATLIERLKQAIENEGHDIETYDFAVAVETPTAKILSPKKTTSVGSADIGNDEKDHTFESFADLVPTENENGETANLSNSALITQQSCENLSVDENHSQRTQEVGEKVEIDVVQVAPAIQESDDQSKNDEEMAVDYEEELAEDEEIEAETDERNMESESISVNADHADNDNCEIVNDENEEEAEQEQNEDDEIPNPEQVESSSMFTAEDTIRLHEAAQLEKGSKIGGASLTDESNSMYVNPDDTLSEMNGLSSATTTSNNNNTNNISTINEEPSTVQDEKLAVNSDKKDKSTENEQKEIQETNESESEEKEEPKREQGKENDEDKQEKVKSESKGPKQISTRSIAEKHPDNCIWVSGIPSTIKAADLKSLFSKHGRVVSAKVVKVKCKGSIQWYGNLVMSSAEETSNCITNLHRTELHGKSISVERGSGSYPPKRPTNQTQSENAVSKVETTKAPSIKQVGPSPIVNDEKKKSLPENKSPNATNSPSIKTSTTELNKSTSQKPTTTKKTPSKEQSGSQKDEKKKSETSEKTKEKEDKRARSSSKSVKSRTDRSSRSKERRSRDSTVLSRLQAALLSRRKTSERVSDNRRSTTANRRQVVASRPVYSNANRNVRGSRAGARSFRGARGRFPPPPERRYLRGGFRGRGSGVVSASSAYRSSYTLPPTSLMSTALPSFSRPPLYRPPPAPPTAQAMIDIRRDQREKEMMERMRQKEQEHKQREDMLRLEREKEKLKWERERLEREKLEIQQMRMQAAYERNAIYATPQLLTAGVKRAYEGLDPYASQQESKRASYGIQDSSPHNMEKISSSSRRTPTRSYPSGGRSSDSYHRSSGSRYEATPRSSRDVGKQSSSSFGKNSSSYKISSSRRSDAKSSRNSRYSPPPSSSRRGGGRGGRQEDVIVATSSSGAKSWSASGSSLPTSYSQSRNSGSSGMPGLSIGTSLTSLGDWSGGSGAGVISPTSAHWRALSSGGASLYTNSAQQSAASLSAYNNLSSSTQSYADRFDAYRFPASSSSKRY